MTPETAVAVFLKYPEAGKVKTRLAAEMGPEPAAKLYAEMVRRIRHGLLSKLPAETFRVRFFCDPFRSLVDYRAWLGEKAVIEHQRGPDLGSRLEHAFRTLLGEHASAVAIGTDCLDLEPRHLEMTRAELTAGRDLVLGPAEDGGYYLIGMRALHPGLFRGVEWSTERVLSQTLERAREAELSVKQLETLADIDTWEDLQRSKLKSADGTGTLPD